MEGERLPQVTVEIEGKTERGGKKKHTQKKNILESGRRAERMLENSKEEIHNEYRAEMDQV